MRFLASAVATLVLTGFAAAREAHVYLSNGNASPASDALSPESARVVFAQRLGLLRTQRIQEVDDKTIEALNDFGGRAQKLFGQDENTSRPKAFIMVEGVREPKGWPQPCRDLFSM